MGVVLNATSRGASRDATGGNQVTDVFYVGSLLVQINWCFVAKDEAFGLYAA